MKKSIALGLCAMMGVGAYAQVSVVKEAEKVAKNQPYAEVVKVITPAMSNPETAQNIQTYLIPAEAGFKQYDKNFEKMITFQTTGFGAAPTQQENVAAAEGLLGGYGYYMQALPLDSLPDAKGKVKPKHSGKIIKEVGAHLEDFNRIASTFYEVEDYGKAFESWDVYTQIVENPLFAKAISMPADTMLNAIYFNKGLAAYFAKDYPKTYSSLIAAKDKGFNKKVLYDIVIPISIELGDTVAFENLNREANALYGQEEPGYINNIINLYLSRDDYDHATSLINDALKQNPDNATYHFLLGVIYSNMNDGQKAIEKYKDALAINPEYANAYFNYGLEVYKAAMALNDEGPTDPQAYGKYFNEKVKPQILEAIDLLEKAWNINNDLTDALRLLKEAYYNVGNEAMEKDVDNRMKY